MGIAGAAIATGISQTVSMLIVLTHFVFKKGELRIRKIKPQIELFRLIVVRGFPEMVSQFATPVTTFCMNFVLIRHIGEIGVNSYSLICYIASFSIAVFMGVSEGLQPLFGLSYGEGNEKDLRYYLRSGFVINICGSCICILAAVLGGNMVCKLFGADSATTAFTIKAIPMYAWGFLFMAVNTVVSSYFYSTEKSKQASILNIMRCIVFSTVCIMTLPAIFGEGIVWFTFGIAEVLSMVLALTLLRISEENHAG